MRILLSSISLETASDFQLALYYLKSYLLKHCRLPLRKDDITVRVFNETQIAGFIAGRILKDDPSLVGFSCYLWNITLTLEVCRLLKRRRPQLRIVLGGPEASPRAEEILAKEPQVDLVVRGEGEVTFARMLETLGKGGPLSRVRGITFRRKAAIVSTPDRPTIKRLGVIPSPYLNGLIDLKDKAIIDVPLETTRGCSFRCSYCYYHKNFPRLRFFPLSRVERELKYILKSRPTEVYLMDATFNANPRRAMKVLELFSRYNCGSTLHLELMAELVDEPMARALARANAAHIEIGLQSTNLPTLQLLNRPFDKERFSRGIALLNRYNLVYEIQLIDALPLQTYGHILKALDWLYSLRPSKVELFPLSVLAGTSLAGCSGRYGIAYDPAPPYRVYASKTLSREQVLRLRTLRFAMDRLYDSMVFRRTLYALKDRAKIRIATVLEDWIDWESGIGKRGSDYPQQLNRRLPEFLVFVLRRHGRMHLARQLAAGLSADLAEYRKAYGA